LSNPDKPWYWYCIGCNPNITTEDLLSNPDKPWNWYWVSRNPNITMEFILSNPDKPWAWDRLSRNHFNYKKNKRIKKFKRKLLVHLLCVSAFNYEEVRYRPGNSGFEESLKRFNDCLFT
jgi:hypothetical protein